MAKLLKVFSNIAKVVKHKLSICKYFDYFNRKKKM